jgi:hypothetical protein
MFVHPKRCITGIPTAALSAGGCIDFSERDIGLTLTNNLDDKKGPMYEGKSRSITRIRRHPPPPIHQQNSHIHTYLFVVHITRTRYVRDHLPSLICNIQPVRYGVVHAYL